MQRAHPLEPIRLFRVSLLSNQRSLAMKGGLAWLIGIPIPVIIVLYLLDVF